MGKPDVLSQRADHGTGSDDNSNVVLLSSKLFTICAVEGLEFIGPERDVLRDIRKGSRWLDQASDKEPVVKAVHELQKSSSHSLHSAEWSEHDGLLYYCSHIYVEGAKHQFEIWMDHKNLEYFMAAKQLN